MMNFLCGLAVGIFIMVVTIIVVYMMNIDD